MRIMNMLIDMLIMAGIDETDATYDVLIASQTLMFEHAMTCPDNDLNLTDKEKEERLAHNKDLEEQSETRIKKTLTSAGHTEELIDRLLSLGRSEQYTSYQFLYSCNCEMRFDN